jgi:2-polyprenyl-3-methyl-5-hydroxy-6-metoxy-1,4-benzoquinol methylase
MVKTMTKDLMSSKNWNLLWRFRNNRDLKSRIKKSLREWALKDVNKMLGAFMDAVDKPILDVIELGCAPGLVLRELNKARPDHNLHGVDYSDEGLAIAKKFLEEKGVEANLIKADILTYTPSRTYDLVISGGLIEHYSDPVEILRAHKKFAGHDGLIVAIVPNLSNFFVKKALENFRPNDLQTHNLDIMNKDALFKLFSESGLSDIKTGGSVGPLLPTPYETPTIKSKAYKYFSYLWNYCIRFIPTSLTWHGYYWAQGRP